MKVLIVFVIAAMAITAQAHLTEEQKTKLKGYYGECVESTGADKKLITDARKGEFVEDEKLMAYYSCMMVKMGFQNVDGTLNPTVMKNKLPDSVDVEKGAKVIDKCTKVDAALGKDKVAYTVFKCFIESVGKEVKFF